MAAADERSDGAAGIYGGNGIAAADGGDAAGIGGGGDESAQAEAEGGAGAAARPSGADAALTVDVDSLRTALDEAGGQYLEVVVATPGRFDEAMADDFNTALAIAVLFDLARATNGFRQHVVRRGTAVTDEEAALFVEADRVFTQLGGDLLGVVDDGFRGR